MNVYDFKANSIDGIEIPLSDYLGKVLLIVNVASRCGYTPQYEALETLYERYKEQGFAILGFPCNQFGGQEPATESEIKSFCTSRFSVKFPLFAKIDVNGQKAHPLYQFLQKDKPGILGTEGIKWNFTKFLVNRQGVPVKRYAPGDKPETIEEEIKNLVTASS
ncbi:MAG TPA: glutathione peroxidase [Nitrospiria bacterium]|nr:glutathione peroxidase [Nitrospiria bacterium]